MTIDETTFALVDTETSGLEDGCDLLEVAVHLYSAAGTEVGERYSSLVKPTKPVPAEASGIHGLIDDDFQFSPSREVVMNTLAEVIPAEAIIVAHNAGYDMGVLGWDRPAICSERLAHHLTPDAPNFKLGTLRYFYGFHYLDVGAAHRADADLLVLAPVFFHLIERYRAWAAEVCADDGDRLAKSEQIDSLLRYAASPYTIERWPMGPPDAKGKKLSQLDAGLLDWALKKADLGPDLRYSIELEKRRRRAA